MTLCDAGPLIALINANDIHHHRCMAALPALIGPLRTTWPCFVEAMYLAGRSGGYRSQVELWSYLDDGLLTLHQPAEAETKRMRVLMEQYSDAPMDLADASLVAAAETLEHRRVFTLDKHFYAYRTRDVHAFEIVP